MRSTWGWVVQVSAWATILAVVAVLSVAVVVPRMTGATPYTVLTGSMQPHLPPGTLAVTKPVEFEDIAAGDVVTYQLKSGRESVVTHRVVSTGTTLAGVRQITTRGDANSVVDQDPVREMQVRGRLWYAVPHLGKISNTLTGDQRGAATAALAIALLIYSAYMLATAVIGKLSRQPTSHPGEEQTS